MPFRFQVISLFPEMVKVAMSAGVFSQAEKKDLLQLSVINPRDFASDVHRTVDDRPFGGDDGMILMPEPIFQAVATAKAERADRVVYLSPQGAPFTAERARELASLPGLILLCGRYGGIDQRVLSECVDEEISVGDFVVSGGELAACLVMDAISRFIPGVLGHKDSAEKDSFSHGLLEQPNFTRPREFHGVAVPDVLLGGNHKAIQQWKQQVSFLTTLAKRPDLLTAKRADDSSPLPSPSLPPSSSLSLQTITGAKTLWQNFSADERRLLGLEALTEAAFEPFLHGDSSDRRGPAKRRQ